MTDGKDGTRTNKLYVYECRGARLPGSEPTDEGFLGIWPEPPFYYLFYDRHAMRSVIRWVENQKDWLLRDTYELDYLQWQQIPAAYHRVGPFVIRTEVGIERDAATCPDNTILINLDPGVVFGSGLHATTKGCLLTLAGLYERHCFRRVVDLGTGTGILALACALLGASRVWALDSNSLAARVAKRNVAANGLENVIVPLVAEGLQGIQAPADLLVMNIEWPCLKRVLQGADWLDFRTVILSGFLASQWAELERLLPPGTEVLSRQALDGWLTLAVSTQNASDDCAR